MGQAVDERRILYIGDIHGPDQSLLDGLVEAAKCAPEALIFIGDVVGSRHLVELQRLFYDWLNNHSMNGLFRISPQATDEEILSYTGSTPPEPAFTLKNGFLKLRRYELMLAGHQPEEIAAVISTLSDRDIAAEIRGYAKYVHYGHYVSNLSNQVRENLASGLRESARRLLTSIKMMQERGTQIAIMEGNWDARTPIDYVPGIPAAVPLPVEQRPFHAKRFFQEHGVNLYSSLATLETTGTLQVLLPFDALINFARLPGSQLEEVDQQVMKARGLGKCVIVVAHGEPNWQIHHLLDKQAEPTGEHVRIIEGLTKALGRIAPDEVVYGHMHTPLVDGEGKQRHINCKYLLEIRDDGTVELAKIRPGGDSFIDIKDDTDVAFIRDIINDRRKTVIASFIPFRRFALKRSGLDALGRDSDPIQVIESVDIAGIEIPSHCDD